ncbi:hypothetical protein [Thermodesulfobacterium hydrogeniphilum]|nr:hypothetical protein [Thermodesulfobacterium hydrogeniphilum]
MKKLLIFLILLFFLFTIGIKFHGYDFVHSRASTICLSCMGLGDE